MHDMCMCGKTASTGHSILFLFHNLKLEPSRSDIDSLSKTSKGWQQRTALATGGATKKKRSATANKRGRGTKGVGSNLTLTFPTSPPTSSMEFERDWRRHGQTAEARMRYLRLCGTEQFRVIFQTEIDVSLMGQILKTFAERASFHQTQDAAAAAAAAADESKTAAAEPETSGEQAAVSVEDDLNTIKAFLEVLPDTGRFALNVNFMEKVDLANAASSFDWLVEVGVPRLAAGDEAASAQLVESLAAARVKFGC